MSTALVGYSSSYSSWLGLALLALGCELVGAAGLGGLLVVCQLKTRSI